MTARLAWGCALPIFGVLVPLAGAQGIAISDTFNRPNSTNLGPDWVEREPVAGNALIQNNKFKADNTLFGFVSHTAYQATYVNTVVRADWDFAGEGYRMGLVAGANYSGNWEGIEVRLQDNDGDPLHLADRIFFNAAPNAGTWPAGAPPIGPGGFPIAHPSKWFDLATPIASGTLTIWFEDNGNTVVAEVKSAAGGTETFRVGGTIGVLYWVTISPTWVITLIPPPSGTTVGITYEGGVTVDDFRAWTGSPQGPIYSMNTPRSGRPLDFLVTAAAPASAVALFASATGPGPLPTPWGPLLLTPPIVQLVALPTTAAGRASVRLPNVSASLQGLILYNQAFDAGSLRLTNGFVTRFL